MEIAWKLHEALVTSQCCGCMLIEYIDEGYKNVWMTFDLKMKETREDE
jgi:hypothetical protein